MAEQNLKGMKIAILVTDGFEQVELTEPRKALDKAGADTKVVSPREMRVRSWKFTDWGDELPVDVRLNQARPEDFDALHLLGIVHHQRGEYQDAARRIEAAVQERRQFGGRAGVPFTEEPAGQDRLPQGPTRFDRRRALFDCRRGGTCYRHFVTHGVAGPAL